MVREELRDEFSKIENYSFQGRDEEDRDGDFKDQLDPIDDVNSDQENNDGNENDNDDENNQNENENENENGEVDPVDDNQNVEGGGDAN